jgi:hypothetical protein
VVRGQGGPCARFALPPSSFYNHGRAQVRPISQVSLFYTPVNIISLRSFYL